MLESLYPFELVERRWSYAVLLGICYSLIALGISVIFFPSDPSLISIGIITLLFYPTVQKLLLEHEKIEAERYHKGLFSFMREHKNVLVFYLMICITVFLVFFFFSFLNPQNTSILFSQQQKAVNPIVGSAIGLGSASFTGEIFYYITHNTGVLLVILLASFFLGEGGILLLTWNASSWGVFFGATLSTLYGWSFKTFSVLATVLPHILLEFSAYIVGAISVSILSKVLFSVRIPRGQRTNVIYDSMKGIAVAFVLLVIAAIVEVIAFRLV